MVVVVVGVVGAESATGGIARLERDKATSSVNLEASETQNPSEIIKVVDYELLETDPGIRPPISSYHPDIQNEVIKDVDLAKIAEFSVFGYIAAAPDLRNAEEFQIV
ncbi:hypothetical protein JHK84_050489 [Glycine max]|nr:hypothetical protein JHK84_050489 [Glycine max]